MRKIQNRPMVALLFAILALAFQNCSGLTSSLNQQGEVTSGSVVAPDALNITASAIQPGAARNCRVESVAQMQVCVQKLNANEVDSIEVTRVIRCTQPAECAFMITSRGRAVRIFGADRTGAGFLRSRESISGSTLFFLDQASQVKFENLRFEDPKDYPVATTAPVVIPYSAVIAIKDSSQVVIEKALFLNSWTMAIQISNSNAVQLLNSVISNPMIHGVWTNSLPADRVSRGVTIENNLFIDSVANVLALSLVDSVVRKNAFVHNHRFHFYFNSQGIPFPGGQMSVEPHSRNLLIEGNVFRDGFNTHPGHMTSAIEFTDSDVNDVRIIGNDFHHNTGAAIFQDVDANGQTHRMSGIRVYGNRHYANGDPRIFVIAHNSFALDARYSVDGNCDSAGCGAPIQFGKVWPEIISCNQGSGVSASQCLTQLRWVTNDLYEVRLQAGSGYNTVGAGPAGVAVVNWVPPAGVDFFVYSGVTAIDWQFIAQTP